MNFDEVVLEPAEERLLQTITSLQSKLDEATFSRYKRINPLTENLTDWREKGAKYAGKDAVVYESATLIGDIVFGENVWIGEGCMIDGSGGLRIGDYVVLACGVHVYTHDTAKWALSGGKAPYNRKPVEIGECVFVGAQSVITCGVSIGAHSLICANATVVCDVPEYSIVAGTPATVIGKVIVDGADVTFVFNTHKPA